MIRFTNYMNRVSSGAKSFGEDWTGSSRPRRVAASALWLVAAVVSSMGIVRACSSEGVSQDHCSHMEMLMGDTSGARFAGLRQENPSAYLLHLSPHLVDTFDQLIATAPSETRFLFEILRRNFDQGTELLQELMGYSDSTIEKLRVFEFTENTRIVDLIGPGTGLEKLEAASTRIADLLDSTYFAREAGEVPRFRENGVKCGVFPETDEGECPDLVSDKTIAATYGFPVVQFDDVASVTYDDGNCMWTLNYEPSPDNPEGTDGFLWVDVYSSTTANRVLTGRLAEPGDVTREPVIVDGARHSIGVFPCGRTAYVDADGRSATIAACGPRDLSDSELVEIALEAIASR